MGISITLIAVISVIALVATLLLGGKSDEGYNNKAKENITLLSFIYIVAIGGSLVALAIFIF